MNKPLNVNAFDPHLAFLKGIIRIEGASGELWQNPNYDMDTQPKSTSEQFEIAEGRQAAYKQERAAALPRITTTNRTGTVQLV